ncbi:LOW QUALITY PROTEIN: nephrin-like, partial [Aegotheles albertisi]
VVLVLLLLGVKGGGASWPFVEEPSNGSAVLGQGAELRCVTRGGGAVQWARGGSCSGLRPTPAHPRYRLAGDPRRGEHHLRVGAVTLEDDDVFECQVGEGNGTEPRASRPAQLTVLVPPGPPRLELPEGAELPWVGGAEVTLRCHAPDTRPPARLSLTLGGVPLTDVTTRILEGSHPKLSSSEATVRLTPPAGAQGQLLLCEAQNEAGASPTAASLVLDLLVPPGPPTIEGLQSPHVRAGETLRLECVVRGGNPPPSLHWDKDGRPLAASWVTEGDPGVSRSRVTLTVTPDDDRVTLRCHAHSPLPSGGGSASVTLSVTCEWTRAEVTITGTPTVGENGTVTLSCTSAPSNPPARLRWWLGGQELTPTESARTPARGRGWVTVTNVTLRRHRRAHGGTLLCEAETPGLGTHSASVTLSVTRAPPQALWLEAPPPNVTFRVGERVRLRCHARGGHPSPRLQWSKDGRPLKEGTQASGGARGGGGDAGADADVAPLSVTIVAAPEVRAGQSLTLTCLAGSAHPPPTLRWHRQGHP